MKKLVILALLLFGVTSYAQDTVLTKKYSRLVSIRINTENHTLETESDTVESNNTAYFTNKVYIHNISGHEKEYTSYQEPEILMSEEGLPFVRFRAIEGTERRVVILLYEHALVLVYEMDKSGIIFFE